MKGRFYLSTRKDRAAEAAVLLDALKANGWERTFDWAQGDAGPDEYADIAKAELAGVCDADVLIVLAQTNNARSETASTKPAFRDALKSRMLG